MVRIDNIFVKLSKNGMMHVPPLKRKRKEHFHFFFK
jgi:hypothetical protein